MKRSSIGLCALVAAALVAGGCGSNSKSTEALPINQRPVTSSELGGIASDGPVAVEGLAEFAKSHEKSEAELKSAGFVEAGTQAFKLEGPGNSFSIVAVYDTVEQAEAEATRLYESNSKPEEGVDISPLEVPGVPGAKANALKSTDPDRPGVGYEIIYTDGSVLYELFAIGTPEEIDSAAGVKAAEAQYARVMGRPLK